MEYILFILTMLVVLGYTRCISTKCDNSSNSVLVEQFFNIIFSEFQESAPICVCVQMCIEQPTYCYPNGCLKRSESDKKLSITPLARISDTKSPIFFVDDNINFITEFLNKNYIRDSQGPAPASLKRDVDMETTTRSDTFKGRYKILFNNKSRMPKVDLKYNLGDQVKNMKSDITKTMWPTNKINHPFNGQRAYTAQEQAKYFKSMLLNKDAVSLPSKYFKRALADTTTRKNAVDKKVRQVFERSSLDHTNFSLESLVESLIEGSFESNKTANLVKQDESTETILQKNITTEEYLLKTEENLIIPEDNVNSKEENILVTDDNVTTDANLITMENTLNTAENTFNNDMTNVISMNFTNENIDKNKYLKTNTENGTSMFSKMIASITKKNKTLNFLFISTSTSKPSTTATNRPTTVEKVITKSPPILETTVNVPKLIDYDIRKTKNNWIKSRQKLSKKMQHSKFN